MHGAAECRPQNYKRGEIMNIGEKTAYLKGLAEGIEISTDTKEGKLLTGILDVLGDIASSLKSVEDGQEELFIYAEELDEDLGVLEKAFIKNDYTGFLPEEELFDEDYEDFGDLEGAAKINCPDCGELILFDLEDIEDDGFINCPECGAEISVVGDFSDLDLDLNLNEEKHCGGCCANMQAEQNTGE